MKNLWESRNQTDTEVPATGPRTLKHGPWILDFGDCEEKPKSRTRMMQSRAEKKTQTEKKIFFLLMQE